MMVDRSSVLGYSPRSFAPRTNSASFAEMMNNAAKKTSRAAPTGDSPPARDSAPEQVKQAYDPVSAYEQMTGKAVPERAATYKINGVNWSDETLAVLVGNGGSIPIDTTKTINWESKGDKQLTTEQIAELGEKYKMSNLSAQDFYDLMSDLTNMEVLSGEDCAGMHLAKASGGLFPGGSQFAGKSSGFDAGNIMEGLGDAIRSMMENLDWINSSDYDAANMYGDRHKTEYKTGVERDIKARQNVLNLLQQIQRG